VLNELAAPSESPDRFRKAVRGGPVVSNNSPLNGAVPLRDVDSESTAEACVLIVICGPGALRVGNPRLCAKFFNLRSNVLPDISWSSVIAPVVARRERFSLLDAFDNLRMLHALDGSTLRCLFSGPVCRHASSTRNWSELTNGVPVWSLN